MKKITTFQIFTIASIIGMICWRISDYFGGMIIHLFQYWPLIFPILILYIVSLFRTLILITDGEFKKIKLLILMHSIFPAFLLILSLIDSDVFKPDRVLTATLKDDLFRYILVFREDGSCENNIIGFLGFKDKYTGFYKMTGDTIIFNQKPYDNNFIPDTLFIDRAQNAIFLHKDRQGKFYTKKEWLNHFKIR